MLEGLVDRETVDDLGLLLSGTSCKNDNTEPVSTDLHGLPRLLNLSALTRPLDSLLLHGILEPPRI